MTEELAASVDPDPEEEATPRERRAALLERKLDIPMAVLAGVWAVLVAYELVAPPDQRPVLGWVSNVIWGLFVVEFVTKLAVSGKPLRFVRRRWPSVVFLILPALRMLRVLRAVRALRVLPAARVVGSSYRAAGTARALLEGRLAFLVAMTAIVVFSGGQLLYLAEGGRRGGVASLGDALWWAANAGVTSNLVFEPATLLGRLIAVLLTTYGVVVFASVAAALGAFFVESRAERATVEESTAS
jgi:voltage-gated potassium channel